MVHIPDGFMNGGTSLAAGAIAVGGMWGCLRRAARTMTDRTAPEAGLVAAFIFAVQMLNFPVANGTSGHLIGAALAAVLVGPWVAVLCLAVVLIVQSLVFADGGLSALGLNIVNMALVAGLGSYLVFWLTRKILPRRAPVVVVAAAIAAFFSVVFAAGAFVVEYALGGTGSVSIETVATAMLGVHGVIGIGEAVITALTVSLVLGVRPDLVYGARDLAAPVVVRPPVRPRTVDAFVAEGGQ